MTSADLTMLPTTTVELDETSKAKSVLRVIDALEEHDDVQNVYANFDIPDDVLAGGLRVRTSMTRRRVRPGAPPGGAAHVPARRLRRRCRRSRATWMPTAASSSAPRDRAEDEEPAARSARVALRDDRRVLRRLDPGRRHRRGACRCPTRWSRWSTTTARRRGEHPDWDDYRATMARDQRVMVRITLERAGPDRSG